MSAGKTNSGLTPGGLSGLTTNATLYATSDSTAASTGPGSNGYVLTSNGAGSPPTYQPAGTPTFSGLTQYGAAYANSTTTLVTTAVGTSGQVLTSNGGGSAPTFQNVTGGISGLTTTYLPYATSSTTLGNSVMSYTAATGLIKVGGIGGNPAVIQTFPVATGYGSFYSAANSNGTNVFYIGVDGTGFLGLNANQATFYIDGTVTSDYYWYLTSSLQGMHLDHSGNLSIAGALLPTTNLAVIHGGTGQGSALTAGGVIWATSTSAMACSATGSSGQALLSNGTSAPSWGTPTPTFSGLTTHGLALASNATTLVTTIALGTSGQALLSAGASADPAFGLLNLSNTTGTLAVSNGGSGQASALTAGGVIWGASTSAMGCTAAGTTGQLLQSNGTSAPSWTSVSGVISGLTTGDFTQATSSSSIGNSNLSQSNPNGFIVNTATASNSARFIATPSTATYGSALQCNDSGAGAVVFYGLDGTQIAALQTGQAMIHMDGTHATDLFVYSGNTQILRSEPNGLHINAGPAFTYTTGSWTPAFYQQDNSLPAPTITPDAGTSGTYVKIGQMCTITFTVVADITTLGTAVIGINGLPFQIAANGNACFQDAVNSIQNITRPVNMILLHTGINPFGTAGYTSTGQDLTIVFQGGTTVWTPQSGTFTGQTLSAVITYKTV